MSQPGNNLTSPKRTTELIMLHLGALNDAEPAWEIAPSKISGRGLFAKRDLKRGEVIFRDSPIIIGPAARQPDTLNSCSECYKMLPDTRFMCRNGCGLPVCMLCSKQPQHTSVCELFRSWEPNEPDVANSVIIRLLCVARAINLNQDQLDLIYCLQASLDNNHRTEVRNGAKCFRNFPNDKKIIDIMNRTVAVLRTNGFDETEHNTDNQAFLYRALFPLFALVNHDCIPNSYYTFEDKTHNMIMHASVDIPAGTEITATYTKLFSNNIARYKALKKHFVCKCARCMDPTEKGTFISAVYCRNTSCTGLAVPGTKGMPHPDWNCLVCKQKSENFKMMKWQDLAAGAIQAKIDSNSLKSLVQFLDKKSSSFLPDNNHVVITAKLQVIQRLSEDKEDCGPEELACKAKFCDDLLKVLDTLGVGECAMRMHLEKEKAK